MAYQRNQQSLPHPHSTRTPSSVTPGGEQPSGSNSNLGVTSPGRSRSISPTEYAFIMSTGRKSPAAARQDLRDVRSHVMKVHLRRQQQKERAPTEGSLSPAAERRLSKQRVRSSRSPSAGAAEQLLDHSTVYEMDPVKVGIGMLFPGFYTLKSHHVQQQQSSSPGSLQTQSALGPRIGSGIYTFDFGWSPYPSDGVATTAQMYVASAIRDKTAGNFEPSMETLNLKMEAVRIVMEIFNSHGTGIPQSAVLAVSLLAVGSALENEIDQVQSHLHALERLVNMRGGIATLDFDLQRVFTWNATCVAAAFGLAPRFSVPTYDQANAPPLAFQDDASIRAWRTMKKLPKENSFLFDIMLRLHQIGLATSQDWFHEVDHRILSNLYLETLYHIVAVMYDEPWNGTLSTGTAGQEAALMFKVFSMGMAMFIWGSIRHVRKRMGYHITQYTYNPIFSRLKTLVEGPGGYHAWPRGKSLEPVLATLVYCAEACEEYHSWRLWLMDALRTAVGMLKIKTLEQFQKTLKTYPTNDDYEAAAAELWSELMAKSVAGSPQILYSGPQ